jgi:hypothetical protein
LKEPNNRMSSNSVMLKASTSKEDSNWDSWDECWKDDARELNADVATFFTSDTLNIPRPVIINDFEEPPAIAGNPALPPLTAASISKHRETCEIRRDEQIIKNHKDLRSSFKKMWKRVTLEAKIKVKSHAGNVAFDLAESQYDTVKFYRWLKMASASRNIGTNDDKK